MSYSGSHQTRGSLCKSSLLCLNWNRISKFSLSSPKQETKPPAPLLSATHQSCFSSHAEMPFGPGEGRKEKEQTDGVGLVSHAISCPAQPEGTPRVQAPPHFVDESLEERPLATPESIFFTEKNKANQHLGLTCI